MEVTFETKCYEGDWRFLLIKGRLRQMIEQCDYPFAKRTLMINNVNDPGRVRKCAEQLIAQGVIDGYYFVNDYAEKVLNDFSIQRDSFKQGYYYSIAELVSIFVCTTPYLLHFSGDALIEKRKVNWIDDAKQLMESRPDILVANATWDNSYEGARSESFAEDENWFYSHGGFSDQCYLIKPDNFKKDIYNEQHPASERYPAYGGELFEKRVDAYMRNHHLLRITSKHITYIHQNVPKNKIKRFLYFNFNLKFS